MGVSGTREAPPVSRISASIKVWRHFHRLAAQKAREITPPNPANFNSQSLGLTYSTRAYSTNPTASALTLSATMDSNPAKRVFTEDGQASRTPSFTSSAHDR